MDERFNTYLEYLRLVLQEETETFKNKNQFRKNILPENTIRIVDYNKKIYKVVINENDTTYRYEIKLGYNHILLDSAIISSSSTICEIKTKSEYKNNYSNLIRYAKNTLINKENEYFEHRTRIS